MNMIHIKANGSISFFKSTNDIRKLQKKVGGFVEVVRLGNGNVLLVDEDAKMKNDVMPNAIASSMYGYLLLGDVVLCMEKDGEFIGFNSEE